MLLADELCVLFVSDIVLKGISSWNHLINSSYLLSFYSFSFDWLSSLSLFTASLMMAKLLCQALIPIAQQLVLKSESLFEQKNRAKFRHQMWCPHLKWVKDICDVAVFMWTGCSRCNAFMIAAIHWILLSLCIEMLLQTYNKMWPFSLADAFSGVFVLSRFSLPLLAQHWKFFC